MSYFAKFTILWILYNILACTEQNKETYTKDHSDSVIKVEIENDLLDHLDILPIVDTIIPLEVTENNLIGMVGKIRQYHDDYYIFDVQRRKINVFDNSGRFKYNLGQEGKGPGELVFPGDFLRIYHWMLLPYQISELGELTTLIRQDKLLKKFQWLKKV